MPEKQQPRVFDYMNKKGSIEDLSNELTPGKPVSAKMRSLLNKEKKEVRQRIIDRGIVHFRADEEFMVALHDTAEHLKIAPGSLCRRIVWEYLKSQRLSPKTSCIEPPPTTNEALVQRLETIQELLSQALLSRSATPGTDLPADVATLASELRSGQEEICGELREIYAYLVNAAKDSQHRSV